MELSPRLDVRYVRSTKTDLYLAHLQPGSVGFEPIIGFSVAGEEVTPKTVSEAIHRLQKRIADVDRLAASLGGTLARLTTLPVPTSVGYGEARAELVRSVRQIASQIVEVCSYSQVAQRLAMLLPTSAALQTVPTKSRGPESEEKSLADAFVAEATKRRTLTYDPIWDLSVAAQECDVGDCSGFVSRLKVVRAELESATRPSSVDAARAYLQMVLEEWPAEVAVRMAVIPGSESISVASHAYIVLSERGVYTSMLFGRLMSPAAHWKALAEYPFSGAIYFQDEGELLLPARALESRGADGVVASVGDRDYVVVPAGQVAEVEFVAPLPKSVPMDHSAKEKARAELIERLVEKKRVKTDALVTRSLNAAGGGALVRTSAPLAECSLKECGELARAQTH